MNISSGISEINFHSYTKGTSASEKVYIWPAYNNGKVESIHSVLKRTENNAVYTKPSPEERERIMDMIKNSKQYEYSSDGNIARNRFVLQPGSLFDAIV
jgi:hypothetical protein